MKKITIFLVLVGFVFYGCGRKEERVSVKKPPKDELVAELGDFYLTKSLVDKVADQSGVTLDEKTLEKIKKNWSENALIAQEALNRGLDKKPDYEWLMNQSRMSVLSQLLIEELKKEIEKEVTDEEIAQFYQENPQFFQKPGQVHLKHIMVPVEVQASQEDEEKARKRAEELYQEVVSGKNDFTTVATRENPEGQKTNGGDLGWFGQRDLIEPIKTTVFSLKVGEISKPVRSRSGYHIFKVLARDVQPLSEASDHIKQQLVQQKLEAKLDEIIKQGREKYKIQ